MKQNKFLDVMHTGKHGISGLLALLYYLFFWPFISPRKKYFSVRKDTGKIEKKLGSIMKYFFSRGERN